MTIWIGFGGMLWSIPQFYQLNKFSDDEDLVSRGQRCRWDGKQSRWQMEKRSHNKLKWWTASNRMKCSNNKAIFCIRALFRARQMQKENVVLSSSSGIGKENAAWVIEAARGICVCVGCINRSIISKTREGLGLPWCALCYSMLCVHKGLRQTGLCGENRGALS